MRINEGKKGIEVKKYEGKFPVQCTHVRKKLYNVHYHDVWYKWSVEKSKVFELLLFTLHETRKSLLFPFPTQKDIRQLKKKKITKKMLASQSKTITQILREKKKEPKVENFKPRCLFLNVFFFVCFRSFGCSRWLLVLVVSAYPITPFDGGPMGPKSTLFFRKYFSNLARMCLP